MTRPGNSWWLHQGKTVDSTKEKPMIRPGNFTWQNTDGLDAEQPLGAWRASLVGFSPTGQQYGLEHHARDLRSGSCRRRHVRRASGALTDMAGPSTRGPGGMDFAGKNPTYEDDFLVEASLIAAKVDGFTTLALQSCLSSTPAFHDLFALSQKNIR